MRVPPQGLPPPLISKDSSGNTALFYPNGQEVAYIDSNGHLVFLKGTQVVSGIVGLGKNAVNSLELSANGNPIFIGSDDANTTVSIGTYPTRFEWQNGSAKTFNGIATALNGLTPLRGSDIRTGVTTTDASARTLFTNPSSSVQTYRVTCSLIGNSGTISSAVYTLSYTDANNVVISQTVSISAVSTESTAVHLFQVKGSSNITGQLTTLSGTSPSVDISCIVEAVSTGT